MTEHPAVFQERLLRDKHNLILENEKLRALLHRMYDWASASNDWRPDAKLGRDVRAALDHQQKEGEK